MRRDRLNPNSLRRLTVGLLLALSVPATAAYAADRVSLELLGRHSTGVFDESAAEIPAYDAASRRLFVVNGAARTVDVLDIADPTAPRLIDQLDLSAWGRTANSVAVRDGLVAVAVEAADKQAPGRLVLFRAANLMPVGQATVGALPDMLTFTPDGRYVLVANEGEPNADYSIDPEGSVSVVDVSNPARPVARTADFRRFNPARSDLRAAGVRLFGPGASVAQDVEPEYIAVDPRANGQFAFVTLQENNAIAVVHIPTAKVQRIMPLGSKDHMQAMAGLDPSDRDGAIAIDNWPVRGFYMPDAIGALRGADGVSYLVTANEGDARDYAGYGEEARVKQLRLDPVAFPNAAALRNDAALGRLNVTTAQGDTDGDGDFDRLYAFGGRSLSLWTTDGKRVWDTGDELELETAARNPAWFNSDHAENARDNRSDNKGPEPEGLVTGQVGGRTLLFAGLERASGIAIYDLSNPLSPVFAGYGSTRNFDADPETQLAAAGDLGPEGLAFIAPQHSPNGEPLLVVANEVSGTTAIFRVVLHD